MSRGVKYHGAQQKLKKKTRSVKHGVNQKPNHLLKQRRVRMNIDYKKLIPAEIPDDIAYHRTRSAKYTYS
jgi:hypothetical protein